MMIGQDSKRESQKLENVKEKLIKFMKISSINAKKSLIKKQQLKPLRNHLKNCGLSL